MRKREPKEQGSQIQGLPYFSDLTALAVELGLLTSERHLLFLLRSKMNRKQKSCWPGQKQLAKELGKSERQVRRYLTKFEKMNIINISKKKKSRRYGNNVSEYKFSYPWKVKPDTIMSAIKPDILNRSNRTKRNSQCGHSYVPLIDKGIDNSNKKTSSSQLDDDFFPSSKRKGRRKRQN